MAEAGALRGEAAADFPRGVGRAMNVKTRAVLTCREPLIENPGQILARRAVPQTPAWILRRWG